MSNKSKRKSIADHLENFNKRRSTDEAMMKEFKDDGWVILKPNQTLDAILPENHGPFPKTSIKRNDTPLMILDKFVPQEFLKKIALNRESQDVNIRNKSRPSCYVNKINMNDVYGLLALHLKVRSEQKKENRKKHIKEVCLNYKKKNKKFSGWDKTSRLFTKFYIKSGTK